MRVFRLLMDFERIDKEEKIAEFVFDSKRYSVDIIPNPYDSTILFSLYLNGKPVIKNRIVVVGEYMLSTYGNQSFENQIPIDFIFMNTEYDDDFYWNLLSSDKLGDRVYLNYVEG